MKKLFVILISLFSINCFSQIAQYNFTNGLGTDDSGNGNDGTLFGNSAHGDSLLIGSNTQDYFTIPSTILNGKIEFTLSFRIKFIDFNISGSFPTNHLFSGDLSNVYGSFAVSYQKNVNTWYFVTNNFYCSFVDASIIPNQWYCVSLTRNNSGVIKLYVDGIENTNNYTNTNPLAMTSLLVGQETDCYAGCFVQNQAAYAKFDFIYFYEDALEIDEIIKKCTSLTSFKTSDYFVELQIKPNPVSDNLFITNATKINCVEIYSLDGKLLLKQKTNNHTKIDISMEKFFRGIYIVKIYCYNEVKYCKILKV